MKHIIILFIYSIFLTACSNIYFKNPPPRDSKELTVFPKKYIGDYGIDGKIGFSVLEDAIILRGQELQADTAYLEQPDLVLKKFRNKYIISISDDTTTWESYIFSIKNDTLLVSYCHISKNDREVGGQEILEELIPAEVFYRDFKGKKHFDYFLIDPSKKQLEAILRREVLRKDVKIQKIN